MLEMITKILIINGPNLDRLGMREPSIYGDQTLQMIEKDVHAKAAQLGLVVDFRQSNNEGDLVSWIHEGGDHFAGVIINGGALSHTSIGIYDALRMVSTPVIELHLSNIYAREEFRQHSWISKAATGVICGFGGDTYILALSAINNLVQPSK